MNANKQVKLGTILSYVQMGANILIGLLYTPIMIRCLGSSEYGLYNTVSSTISMLGILSLGFNSSYIRFFSKYKKEDDDLSIYKLNGLFLTIFSIIGIIALICGLFLSTHLFFVFSNGLTPNEYYTAKILVVILTMNLSISFPMSVFQNIVSANEKFVFLKVLGMGKTVVSPLISLPLLLMGYRSIAMVLCTTIVGTIIDCMYLYYVINKLNNKFIFHGYDRGLFKSLFTYTMFIAINMFIDQINWNIDKILLGRFKGTYAVSFYSIGYMLYHYYSLFSTSISSLFAPQIHRIVNQNLNERIINIQLTNIFISVGKLQFFVLGLILIGLIIFGKEFISMWAGKEYADAYYITLLLSVPATIPLIQNIGIEIQRAENRHKFRSVAYFIMAIINLLLSIYLCKLYGAIGSAIGTSISLVLANGLVMNIYYHKYCNINIVLFWHKIFKMIKAGFISLAIGLIMKSMFPFQNKFHFIIEIVLLSIIYCYFMWMIGFTKNEKIYLKNKVDIIKCKNMYRDNRGK